MKEGDVVAFKTTSNEEVVATLVEETTDSLVLAKSRAVVMQQMQDGTVSLGMLPFMVTANNPEFASESDVKLYKKDIMGEVVSVPEPLTKAYLKQVSGIALI